MRKGVAAINRGCRYFCTVLLIIMTLLVIFQVISRKFLHLSVAQVEELSRYCMIWAALLGSSLGIATRSHVAVTLLVDRLPGRIRRIAGCLAHIVAAVFFLIITVYGSRLSIQALTQTSPSMPFLKTGYIMTVIPLSGFIGLLNIALAIYDDWRQTGHLEAESGAVKTDSGKDQAP